LYGHELDDWPRFRWDAQQIAYPLGEVRHRQGLEGDSHHCPPLDLSTQGETFEVARKNVIEASQLFLTSCLERGTLDQALRELGFVPMPNEMQEDSLPEGTFSFPVPIPFVFQKPSECHA